MKPIWKDASEQYILILIWLTQKYGIFMFQIGMGFPQAETS